MRSLKMAAALALLIVPATAFAAQTDSAAPAAAAAAPVQRGDTLMSQDGKRIGRVESVRLANGAPSMVGVIYNGKVIYLPVAGLSGGEHQFVSSMTSAQIRKL